MAHSNRAKIKESRGGLTKNQARKAGKQTGGNAAQSDRLRNTVEWMEQRERIKKEGDTPKESTPKKVTRYNKSSRAQKRRARVIPFLEAQLKLGKKNGKELHAKEPNGFHMVEVVLPLVENDIKRIKTEIHILKQRVG